MPSQASNREGFDIKVTSNVGVAIGRQSGFSVGYTKDKVVSMPPDGRVYVEVHSDEQFKRAEELIREFAKIGISVSYGDDRTNQHVTKK